MPGTEDCAYVEASGIAMPSGWFDAKRAAPERRRRTTTASAHQARPRGTRQQRADPSPNGDEAPQQRPTVGSLSDGCVTREWALSRWMLRVLSLVVGLGVLLFAPDQWSYAGLALLAVVLLDVLGAGRQPVREWAPADPQHVTVTECGPKPVEVVKVLREYLEPDPGAASLRACLAAVPSEVGRVQSTAAAEELSGRLARLRTVVTFRPAG